MATAPIAIFTKSPNETLDYTIKWGKFLNIDTISSVVWTIPVGIAQAGTTFSTQTTTVWLAGGTSGQSYTISCQVTSAGGRIAQRSIQINVVDK